MKGLRDFLLRGNALDLAVGAIIGAMFGEIVGALIKGMIEPLIAGLVGKPNFDDVLTIPFGLTYTGEKAMLRFGVVLTAVINFVMRGAVIYFFIVNPMHKALARLKHEKAPAQSTEEKLLEEIRDLLKSGAKKETSAPEKA